MLRIQNTFVNVFRPEVKDNIVVANISSSERITKNNQDPTYVNSNWNNTIFVGSECVEKAKKIKNGDRIIIKHGGVKIAPYVDKNGTTKYPPKVVIFNFNFKEEEEELGKPEMEKQQKTQLNQDIKETDSSEEKLPY